MSLGPSVLIPSLDPFETAFFQHRIEFVATATSAVLNFTNVSPPGVDNSVFLDQVSICPAPPGCVAIHNPNFEMDAHGTAYRYQQVTGWVSVTTGGLVVAQNNNTAWGRVDSGNGAYYLVMQRTGSGVQQQLPTLQAGHTYNVSFLAAERPGYGMNERLQVFMNNAPLSVGHSGQPQIDPIAGVFSGYWATFTASASGRNLLSFENTSPDPSQDSSVFLDAVQVCSVPGAPVNPHPGCPTAAPPAASGSGTSGGHGNPAATAAAVVFAIIAVVLGVAVLCQRNSGGGGRYRVLSIQSDHPTATVDDLEGSNGSPESDALPLSPMN